jgi:hypothetical protein
MANHQHTGKDLPHLAANRCSNQLPRRSCISGRTKDDHHHVQSGLCTLFVDLEKRSLDELKLVPHAVLQMYVAVVIRDPCTFLWKIS